MRSAVFTSSNAVTEPTDSPPVMVAPCSPNTERLDHETAGAMNLAWATVFEKVGCNWQGADRGDLYVVGHHVEVHVRALANRDRLQPVSRYDVADVELADVGLDDAGVFHLGQGV